MKLLRSWLKCGVVSTYLVHVIHLLSAEHAVYWKEISWWLRSSSNCLSVASQNRFLQNRGIAHELAGKYYISQGEEFWARYHLEKAELSFSDWGAILKVDQLREQKKIARRVITINKLALVFLTLSCCHYYLFKIFMGLKCLINFVERIFMGLKCLINYCRKSELKVELIELSFEVLWE